MVAQVTVRFATPYRQPARTTHFPLTYIMCDVLEIGHFSMGFFRVAKGTSSIAAKD